MKLLHLSLRNYRGVESFALEPLPCGVTIVEGPNEAGKTSILEALRLLFQESIKDSSSATAVRRVQPVGRDVATEIHLVLDLDGRRVEFSRRFHRDRMTELRIDGQPPLTGDEAHDAFHRLLNTRLDRALWDALWVQQGGATGQAAFGGSRVLRDALDSASEPANPHDDSVIQRIATEYHRYFTEGRAAETGDLRDARRARDEAAAALALHEGRLQEVEARLAGAAQLEEDMAVARLRLPMLIAARDQANRAVADLREREQELKTLEARAQESAAALRELRAASHQRDQLTANIARGRGIVETQQAAFEKAQAELDTARATHTQLEAEAEAASASASAAEAARTLAEADYGHLNDTLLLGQMRDRSQRVTVNTAALTAAQKRIGDLPIDAAGVVALRQLHLEAVAANAARESAATVVELLPAHDMDIIVDGQPRSFPAGKPTRVTVTSGTSFTLPGMLALTVHPASGAAGANSTAADARARFDDALQQARAASLEEAESIAREREEVERSLRQLPVAIREDLSDLADLADLNARIDRQAQRVAAYREGRVKEPLLPADTTAARTVREEATREVDAARSRERDATRNLEESARRLSDMRTALVEIRTRLESSRATLTGDEAELGALAGATAATPEALAAAVATANDRQSEYQRTRDAIATLRPDELKRAGAETEGACDAIEARIRSAELELATARAAVEAGVRIQSELDQARARAESSSATFASVDRRARAARTLQLAVIAARDAARSRLAQPLQDQIVVLGRKLYGDSFSVLLESDLTIRDRTLNGTQIAFDQLSAGAREQLAILARIATALLVDPAEGVPLVIDDALGSTDPERLQGMGAVLAMAGQASQVIVLTCFPGRYASVTGAKVVQLGG